MPGHPTRSSPLPVFACLVLTLAGACLPGARREPEAPPTRTEAEAPAPVAPAPQPPPPAPPPPPEPRSLACVPRPALSAEEVQLPPFPEKAWMTLRLYELPELSGRGTTLRLRLSTTQMYSCLGYVIPARLSTAPGELLVELGGVKAPTGACLAALGPARGEVVLPANSRGTFTLRLRKGGQEDQYRLRLEEDRIELTPLRARFSASLTPLVLHRAPEGALHLRCIFKHWESRCPEQAAAAGSPTCETFFADPVIANLEPLELKPGAYSLGAFNHTEGCYVRAPEGVEALARHISERYRDPSACLYISLHTWMGWGYSNY